MQPFIADPLYRKRCKALIANLRTNIEEEIASEMAENYKVNKLDVSLHPNLLDIHQLVTIHTIKPGKGGQDNVFRATE